MHPRGKSDILAKGDMQRRQGRPQGRRHQPPARRDEERKADDDAGAGVVAVADQRRAPFIADLKRHEIDVVVLETDGDARFVDEKRHECRQTIDIESPARKPEQH